MNSSFDVQSENLALVTLKERCHLLKLQLKAVDDENTKLKVQMRMSNQPISAVGENSVIADVERLKNEKEQLANQVHLLATENSNMWSRLSRLTVVNRNLTRRFTAISDKLEKYGISSLSESEYENNPSLLSKDYRKNLEDMSLKLINGIKLEKAELERQYAQMVDLHASDYAVPGTDLAFSSDVDSDTVIVDVRKHAERLNHLKHSLVQQQTLLLNSLSELKRYKELEKNKAIKEEVPVSIVPKEEVETDTVEESEEAVRAVVIQPTVEGRGGDFDQICPLCSKHIAGNPETFVDHVQSHFDDGDPDSLNSFVHIP